MNPENITLKKIKPDINANCCMTLEMPRTSNKDCQGLGCDGSGVIMLYGLSQLGMLGNLWN